MRSWRAKFSVWMMFSLSSPKAWQKNLHVLQMVSVIPAANSPSIMKTRTLAILTAFFALICSKAIGQSLPREIEVSLDENAQVGTALVDLGKQFPSLKNFRFPERSRTLSFTVDRESGQISVRDSAHLNFERRPVLVLNLQADIEAAETDPFLNQFAASLLEEGVSARKIDQMIATEHSISVRVLLKDVSESPHLALQSFTVSESAEDGTVAGQVVVDDQDHNEVFAFQILSGNEDELFLLDAESGRLRVESAAILDADLHPLRSLQVQVTDKDGLTSVGTVQVHTAAAPAPEVPEVAHPDSGPSSATVSSPEANGSLKMDVAPTTDPSSMKSPEPSQNAGQPLTTTTEPVIGNSTTPNMTPKGATETEATKTEATTPEQMLVPLPPADEKPISKDSMAKNSGTRPNVPMSHATPEPVVPSPSVTESVAASSAVPNTKAHTTSTPPSAGSLQRVDGEFNLTPGVLTPDGMTLHGEGLPVIAQSPEEKAAARKRAREESEKIQSATLSRNLAVLVVAFTVIGATIFVLYRKATEARNEALRHQDDDEAKLKAAQELIDAAQSNTEEDLNRALEEKVSPALDAESDRESVLESESDTEKERLRSRAPSVPAVVSEEHETFDPESLIDEEFFAEPAELHTASARKQQSLSTPFALSGDDPVSEILASLTSEISAEELSALNLAFSDQTSGRQSSAQSPDDQTRHGAACEADPSADQSSSADTIAVYREKLEQLNARLEAASAGDALEATGSSTHERRRHRDSELDGFGAWNDRPSRYSYDREDSEDSRGSRDSDPLRQSDDQTSERLESLGSDSHRGNPPFASHEAEDASSRVANLRSELADLFAIHSKQTQPAPEPEAIPVPDESKEEPAARTSEETHLDSVAQYLSKLLERTKKEGAEEEIFVDRRKSADKATGKWDGVDRRSGGQKQKPQVKSYIETYLKEHGGQLPAEPVPAPVAEEPEKPAAPPMVRTPVDVDTIRQHMNSFREVATVSVENALASYKIRQARGKLALRTMLMIGLVVVAALAFATTSATQNNVSYFNWMTGAIVVLVSGELCIRLLEIYKHRREMRQVGSEPQRSGSASDKADATIGD